MGNTGRREEANADWLRRIASGLLPVAAAMLFAWTSPAASQVVLETTTLPDTAIALEIDATSDAAVADRIRAILGALDGYDAVDVAVQSGVVTLTGRAVNEAAVRQLDQIVSRVDGVVAVHGRVAASTNLGERFTSIRDRFVARLLQTLSYLPLLLFALLVFLLFYAAGSLLSRIDRMWRRAAPNAFIAAIYAQLVRLFFALLGLVVALDMLGAGALLGSILGAAGIIGLAVGFAVRDTVENFIASLMLSIRQPFAPYDLVEIDEDIGRVVRLTSRATILLSPDGNMIRVPNATVFKGRLVNFSRNPERRFTFQLNVDAAAGIARTREALEAKLAALPFVLTEPAPHVVVKEDTGTAVQLSCSAWIDQRTTNWDQSRGEAIRVLRAEMARVVNLDGRQHGAARQLVASQADLDASALPDLTNTEERDLERMVEAERRSPKTKDMLILDAPKE